MGVGGGVWSAAYSFVDFDDAGEVCFSAGEVEQGEVGLASAIVGFYIVGIDFYAAGTVFDGGFCFFDREHEAASLVEDVGVVGIDGERLVHCSEGEVEVGLWGREGDISDDFEGADGEFVNGDGFVDGGDGGFYIALVEMNEALHCVGFGEVGVNGEGLVKVGDRTFTIP